MASGKSKWRNSDPKEGGGYDDDSWFTNALGRPCTLVRNYGTTVACNYKRSIKSSNNTLGMCKDVEFGRMNFVNEGQFLLISDQSVSDLNNRLRMHRDLQQQQQQQQQQIVVNEMRFRPNLVISGGKAYEEDGWTSLAIGNIHFRSLGGCNRCQMINLNPREAELKRSNEPLATLATYRRTKGKIYFGILLKCDDVNKHMEDKSLGSFLQVGQQVYPYID
jgi:molybdenum cofactor sulfurtransferase